MASKYDQIIRKAYRGFNERKIKSVLSLMDSNVLWPKAFEGGHVKGHQAVGEYWTRQWNEINPKVEPLEITDREDGKVSVRVQQLVKDLEGTVLFDGETTHVFTFNEQLILAMDLE